MSSLRLYNTLSKKIEDFVPIDPPKVNMFVCGPTVYDFAHIGNAKTYTQFDFVARYLRYRGYEVYYLQNITNIDDKILKRSEERGVGWEELSKEYEDIFYEDMMALHNTAVTKFARATDFIAQIVNQVKVLMERGYAYKTSDGIYYDIKKFFGYGKLSGRTQADQDAGVSRIDESHDKKNPNDFCLWKFSNAKESFWETELGNGRPGWHIEDTAITETFFGPQYDIHGGAIDLIFPHHEAEIAQIEAASGKSPLVRFWMHGAFLNVNSQKMSKSRGNFTTMRDVVDQYGYRLVRYFFISANYRTTLDYSEGLLNQALGALDRLDEFTTKINPDLDDDLKMVENLKQQVLDALDNDLDTPKAMAAIFDFIRDHRLAAGKNTLVFFKELNQVFDFFIFEKEIPVEIQDLMDKRNLLRGEKKYDQADEIRKKIELLGYKVSDEKA